MAPSKQPLAVFNEPTVIQTVMQELLHLCMNPVRHSLFHDRQNNASSRCRVDKSSF